MQISVITINLNNSEGLIKTIKSVLSQTYVDFEFIIIDGGSTDGSREIILEAEKHSSDNPQKIREFKWISEPDSGIYHAMNKGIMSAKGVYCYFLNSGDYLASPSIFENVMNLQPTEDIVFGNLLVCINNKVIEKSWGKENITFFDIYLSVLKHQATFIKRSLFEKFGMYNESLKIVADWEFFLKTVGLNHASYKYINEDIVYFDNNGISNNSHSTRIRERNLVIGEYIPQLMIEDYKSFERYAFLKNALNYQISNFCLHCIAKCVKIYENTMRKV